MESKLKALIVTVFCFILVASVSVTYVFSAIYGYQVGYVVGFEHGVTELSTWFTENTGYQVTCKKYVNGSYQFTLTAKDGTSVAFTVTLHLLAQHYRNGVLLSETNHPMTLTNLGKDYFADFSTNPSSSYFKEGNHATWIGMDNSSDAVDTAWVVLPAEITLYGLQRANGTWTNTGTGTWNITNTFTASATTSTKLYGYYFAAFNDGILMQNSLAAAEQQGVGAQKNLVSGDTLKVTIQGTVS